MFLKFRFRILHLNECNLFIIIFPLQCARLLVVDHCNSLAALKISPIGASYFLECPNIATPPIVSYAFFNIVFNWTKILFISLRNNAQDNPSIGCFFNFYFRIQLHSLYMLAKLGVPFVLILRIFSLILWFLLCYFGIFGFLCLFDCFNRLILCFLIIIEFVLILCFFDFDFCRLRLGVRDHLRWFCSVSIWASSSIIMFDCLWCLWCLFERVACFLWFGVRCLLIAHLQLSDFIMNSFIQYS